MSETAAFFANKKKKKKTYKFNANLIDVATVTNTVHVDAPALSTDADMLAYGIAGSTITDPGMITTTISPATMITADNGGDGIPTSGEWDDEALAASLTRKGTPAVSVVAGGGSATAELLDMKALEAKRRGEDDIAERLRIEETRAQLAAAKEGMEREAQRLKEERESKGLNDVTKQTQGGSSGTTGLMGSKWVPSRLRALDRGQVGSVSTMSSSKLDTQDENLFPDLASAEVILEQKKEQVAYKVIKKTAVGGGATWGSRPSASTPKDSEHESKAKAPEPELEPNLTSNATTAALSAPSVPSKKVAKKKKKDVSTFKVTPP